MGRLEVEVKKKVKNPLEDRTPSLGEALAQKYEVENFKDRKVTVLTTRIGQSRTVTGEVQDDPIDALLKSHVIATQGGIWREHPEKELAFWQLVDFYRWSKEHLQNDEKGQNPLIGYLANKIRTLYFARYDQALHPDQTTVKTVVAMPPMLGFNPAGNPYTTEILGQPAQAQQKKD